MLVALVVATLAVGTAFAQEGGTVGGRKARIWAFG